MRTLLVALFCFACGLTLASSFAVEEEANVLRYAFTPPAFSEDGTGTVFFHFLPIQGQFAPNINCMAQSFEGTLADYDTISRNEFKQLKMTLLASEQHDDHLTYEYHGRQQGLEMHWYTKAYKRGDKIYLITATGLHDKWEEHAKALVPAVDSFKLMNKVNVN